MSPSEWYNNTKVLKFNAPDDITHFLVLLRVSVKLYQPDWHLSKKVQKNVHWELLAEWLVWCNANCLQWSLSTYTMLWFQSTISELYNYEEKGHFSCSGRHPNELVATYLTLLSTATDSTLYFAAEQEKMFLFCHSCHGQWLQTAKMQRYLLDACMQSEQLFIKKNNKASKVMP